MFRLGIVGLAMLIGGAAIGIIPTADGGVPAPAPAFTPIALGRVVVLNDLPGSMLGLPLPPTWIMKRRPEAPAGSIPPASGGAYYVKRSGVPLKGCGGGYGGAANFADTVDLRQVRAHGFTVFSAEVQSLPVPNGLTRLGGRDVVEPRDAGNQPMPDGTPLAKASRLVVRTPVFGTTPPKNLPAVCFNGYRLVLKVFGPAGINPITGAKIGKPGRVN